MWIEPSPMFPRSGLSEAVASYEAALAREAEFPKLLTLAYLELSLSSRSVQLREGHCREPSKYLTSTSLVSCFRSITSNGMLPWRFIHRGLDDSGEAVRSFAAQALAASKVGTSGFPLSPRHQAVRGFVTAV